MLNFSQRSFQAAVPMALQMVWSDANLRWKTSRLLMQANQKIEQTGDILDLIDALKKQEKSDKRKGENLYQARKELSSNVIPLAELHHVSSEDEDADLHADILAKEAVHKPQGFRKNFTDEERLIYEKRAIAELREKRFGTKGQNKDCQTLIIPHASGRRLIGQILRFKFKTVADPHHAKGGVFVDKLPGNVDEVIEVELEDLTGEEDGIGYYSISADFNVKSAGEELKARLAEANPDNDFETTISPIRELFEADKGGYDRSLLEKTDDEIRAIVLDFIGKKIDMPSKSHLGSGAFVGWIHINRESKKDPVIVNYIYDRELLEFNKHNYHTNDVIPMSEPISKFSNGNLVVAPSQRVSRRTYDMAMAA